VTFTPTDYTNYNSATTSITLIVNPISMTTGITVTPYNGTYDASAHGITVALSDVAEGATVKYRTSDTGEYNLTENPTYTDAGTYTVYYQVTKENYATVTASSTVTIAKAAPTYTAPTALALTYTSSAQNLISAGTSEHGTFTYSTTQEGTYSATIPTGTNAGTYTVWYKFTGDNNHSDVAATEVTGVGINKATATISYATATMTKVFGDAAFTNALSNTPAEGTDGIGLGTVTSYAVTAENKDEGCTSDVVTVDATSGQVTITVTDGTNYTYGAATASYNLTVTKGTITASASNRTYTYSGVARSITVSVTKPSSGYTILYSTDNSTWSATKPSRTNVGTYTTYYKVTAPNYNDKTGSATVTINRATGSISFDEKEVEKTCGDANFTKTYDSKTGNGSISYSSDNTDVATVNASTGEVTIMAAGTANITVSMAQSTNYTSASDAYQIIVKPQKTTVTIGGRGMITYCGTDPLDFTGNVDVTAYTVIGCSYNSNTIWMSRVYKVPAGTPIVIKGTAGTFDLNIATQSDSYYKNKLVGNISGSTIQVNETNGTLRNYYLKDGTFKRVNSYANILNGKAYLQLPASAAAVKAGSTQEITLSSAGKSTLCSDVDLDFSGMVGLKAYVVTGYDKDTKTFWLNRVIEASAGTPLYLSGTANATYSIPSKAVQTSFEDMLVGNTSGSTIKVNETADGSGEPLRNLYLKDGTFKLVKNFVNITNGRCYLQAPSTVVAAMARGIEDPDFSFIFSDEIMSISFSDFDDDSEATGIMSVEKDNPSDAIYDLQGRRVIAPKKGLYIKNGRKVVLK
jgi:hypothetical protein